jgi:von Willebrand factor type D domain
MKLAFFFMVGSAAASGMTGPCLNLPPGASGMALEGYSFDYAMALSTNPGEPVCAGATKRCKVEGSGFSGCEIEGTDDYVLTDNRTGDGITMLDLIAPTGWCFVSIVVKAYAGGVLYSLPSDTINNNKAIGLKTPQKCGTSDRYGLSQVDMCMRPCLLAAPTQASVGQVPTDSPAAPSPLHLLPVPTPSAAPTPKGAPTKGWGDPHFMTWSGSKFDFHGECDLVFVQNPQFRNGLGLHIHMRTKMRRNWSYVDVAAIQIGTNVLEVKGGNDEHYWIDQVEYDATPTNKIGEFGIRYQRANAKQRVFIIDLNEGQSIEVRTYKDFVGVTVHGATEADFKSSVGLTGEFGSGRKLGRGGDEISDLNDYGLEWQVRAEDGLLFRTLEGPQYPLEKCKLPSTFQGAERHRRLGESTIKLEKARQICSDVIKDPADFDSCVFDVLLTDDFDIAGAF